MFPVKTEPIETEMPTVSDENDPLRQSPKAAMEVAEQDSAVNTRVEAWLSGETPAAQFETIKIDKRISPGRPAHPKERPKTQAKDKKNEGTSNLPKKKQQPSSENIFVALAKSAFPDIPLKSPAKSVKFDKNSKPEAETKPLTEGEQAFEKIQSALEKSKKGRKPERKTKGKIGHD
jgi:hypothetical protein